MKNFNIKWVIAHFEEIISSSLFCVVVTLLFVQVVARYLFDLSFAWTEELLRYSFLVMVYFAAALGAKHGTHFRVNILLHYLPKKANKIVDFFTDLTFLSFNLLVIYFSVLLFIDTESTIQISPILGWNVRYINLTLPIAFTFISIRLIIKMIKGPSEAPMEV